MSPNAGYKLERVSAHELKFLNVSQREDLPEKGDYEFAWDWYVFDEETFHVYVRISLPPTTARPEEVTAAVVGSFKKFGAVVEPSFESFVKLNATAMLVPYIRESLSSLTSRGLLGAFVLDPINIVELMRKMELRNTIGAQRLLDRPHLMEAYGLTIEKGGQLSP